MAPMANVRSLGDLGREDSDSDRDDGNDYYAGGEKSGMVVKGGEGSGSGHRAVVDDLFQSARRLGARDGRAEDLPGQNAPRSGAASSSKHAFTGSSYTLSGGPSESTQQGTNGSQPGGGAAEPVMHTITFYRNGIFTVDDGAPRDVQDPANKDFIDSIGRGEVPREFDPANRGASESGDPSNPQNLAGGLARPPMPVHVNLVSRMEEDYVPPKRPKYVAFAGQGLKLSDQTSTGQAGGSPSAPANAAAATESTDKPFELDETVAVTSVQLRLMDGTRMVARFNPSVHTVTDIRNFINRSRPGSQAVSYNLVTAFPTTVLSEEDKTIEELGLANAVILQKAT